LIGQETPLILSENSPSRSEIENIEKSRIAEFKKEDKNDKTVNNSEYKEFQD
jgi:hypothetical protein